MAPERIAAVTPVDQLEPLIRTIRGQKVMLDSDLARVYGVATKLLNRAVKRNTARFSGDFVFQLTAAEKAEVVANCDLQGRPWRLETPSPLGLAGAPSPLGRGQA